MDRQQGRPSAGGDELITRREAITRGLVGVAGLALLPSVLAACKGAAIATPGTAAPTPLPTPLPTPMPSPTPADYLARRLTGNLSVASSFADPPTLGAMKAIDAAFAAETGLAPTLNTIEPGTCADPTIFGACVGTPGDVLSWYSGFQLRQFAAGGLVVPIDDVWSLVKENFAPAFAATVTGADGHIYGIPFDYYPWLFFYRKSVWQARGYEIPGTWDALLALCARMRKDGLNPIAFSDKDGWPAMATFDILNLRLNGYDFHMGLLTGTYKWTDPRVTAVFEAWRKLVPYYPPGSTNLLWQDATASLVNKKAGMLYLGTFMSSQIAFVDPSGVALADIDAFPFPFFGNEFDIEKAIEAPADVWVIGAKSPTGKADLDNARAYLQFWARGSTQLPMARAYGTIPTARDADLSGLGSLFARSAPFLTQARRITQFMDRDTRLDFVGANAMQSFLLSFIGDPNQDLAALEKTIQDFWDALPPLI
jgi:multiple sugar transport system substrate-binding protein